MSPQDPFWLFVRQIWSVRAVIAKAAFAYPLLDPLVRLAPPYPNYWFILALTVVGEIVMTVWFFRRLKQRGDRSLEVRQDIAFVVLAASFTLYLLFFVSFNEPKSGNWGHFNRIITGYTLTDGAQKFVNVVKKHGGVTDQRSVLMANFKDESEKIWTLGSLMVTRLISLMTWAALFASISAIFANFVVQCARSRRQPRQQRYAPPERY